MHRLDGNVPENLLFETAKYCNEDSCRTVFGRVPVIWLLLKSNSFKCTSPPISVAIVPDIWLRLKSRFVMDVIAAMADGTEPERRRPPSSMSVTSPVTEHINPPHVDKSPEHVEVVGVSPLHCQPD